MRIFFIIIFLVYGLIHLYVYLRARAALSFGRGIGICIAFFMAVLTFAPYLVRISERSGHETAAMFISYAGYIWMGILFLFFSVALLIDIYRLLLFLVTVMLRSHSIWPMPSAGFLFFVPLVLSLIIASYGFFEARTIRSEKIVMRTSKLPPGVERFTIAQISDVHLGLIVKKERLKRILRVVEKASPDMVVSTGDLVDGQVDELEGLDEMLMDISPPYGKFAVLGNHEFYAGLDYSLDFTTRAGFRVLRGEGMNLGGIVNIVGVDDPVADRYGLLAGHSEKKALSPLSQERFTLLLKHRPDIDQEAMGSYDLQLSGHTHKGQIFPFRMITRLFYRYVSGFVHLQRGSSLYVSRGSGTWGPPIRFLAPPEVTVIEIVNEGI